MNPCLSTESDKLLGSMYELGCELKKVGLLRKGLVVYSRRQMSSLEIRRKIYEYRIQVWEVRRSQVQH